MSSTLINSDLSQETSEDRIYNGFGKFERENQATLLEKSEGHTFLFELPLPSDDGLCPIPTTSENRWENKHVKLELPSPSDDGLRPIPTTSEDRWENKHVKLELPSPSDDGLRPIPTTSEDRWENKHVKLEPPLPSDDGLRPIPTTSDDRWENKHVELEPPLPSDDGLRPIPTTSDDRWENKHVKLELPLPRDDGLRPIPTTSEDRWDNEHVKLPTSPMSLYSEIGEDGNKRRKQRWHLIWKSLKENEIRNSRDLEKAIKQYNTKYADQWTFSLLHELFDGDFEDYSDDFFSDVLPGIIKLALRLPELIKSPIPLLQRQCNKSISLSQEQAGCLLANAFLCTFPKRNNGRITTDYPEINFNRLFCSRGSQVTEKLKCLLNYFKRICCKTMPTGVLTFQRRYIKRTDMPDWSESTVKFSSIKLVMSSTRPIEDGAGMLQVDFANRYLGGGVLGWGCVQEEIRFVINPELIVGMLFCESMSSEEAIVITGCEQFNKYTGYSKSFLWAGNFYDETPRDSFRRKNINIVAIDAISFHKPHQQFDTFMLTRETNKAFVGFYHEPADETAPIPVCSGNWGCGVYRGNKALKALIQLMACCATRRNLFYCTFGDNELVDEVYTMFNFLALNEITIGDLWAILESFRLGCLHLYSPQLLYSFIYEKHAFQKKEILESSYSDPGDFYDLEWERVLELPLSATGTECIQSPPPKKLKSEVEDSKEVKEEVNTEVKEEVNTEVKEEVNTEVSHHLELENAINLLNENLQAHETTTTEIHQTNEGSSCSSKKVTIFDYFKRKT